MLERFGRRRTLALAVVILFMYLLSLLTSTTPSIPLDHRQWYGSMTAHQKVDPAAEYRSRLSKVRPSDNRPHSKTLGVADSIYVVNLARRTDRRELMESIGRALDIEFTFVDATDAKSQRVARIMDRAKWQRPRIDDREAGPSDWPVPDTESSDELIYNAFPFEWSKDVLDNIDNPTARPLGISGSDYWTLDPPDKAWEAKHPLPPHDEANVMTTVVMNHIFRKVPLTTPMISCWDSHTRIWRMMLEKGEDVAIIFEDDIDIEFDIEKRLHRMWPALPPDWDVVMLGHCWSEEWRSPPLEQSVSLRPMHHTLCTHAYAISRRGAMQILRHLRSPDIAFSRPIDHALKDLAQMHRIKTFSVYPQIAIQTKEGQSDIVFNKNNRWKEILVDSTLERIRMLSNGTEGYLRDLP